jgi:hypothetical protein
MATKEAFASARQFKEDVSDVIREKIGLFRSQEDRISALELELNDLREQHNRLQQELEPYRIQYCKMHPILISPVALSDRSFINHLPEELLYSIFKLCILIPYDNHRAPIGTLLFVCKRWYTLIMSSPKLWSKIEINDPFELFDLINKQSQTSYIPSCLSRSQGLPLDIEIDFESFDENAYIKGKLMEHAKTIIHEHEHLRFWSQIFCQEWNFSSFHFYEELDRFLDHLFGDRDQHLKRYHTLIIDLPQNSAVADIICSRMAQNLSNLTSLEIDGANWSMENVSPRVLALPKVKDLTIRSNYARPLSLSHFGVLPTVLEQIKMNIGSSVLNLKKLSSFKYLRSLTLICVESTDEAVPTPQFSVHLPFLDYFCLVHRYMVVRKTRFEFPSLQVLSLSPHDRSDKLPALSHSPRDVKWHLGEYLINKIKLDPRILMSLLKDVFLLSKTIQRMTFPWDVKDVVSELVQLYQKRGDIPSHSHIVFERDGYPSQVIEVGHLS